MNDSGLKCFWFHTDFFLVGSLKDDFCGQTIVQKCMLSEDDCSEPASLWALKWSTLKLTPNKDTSWPENAENVQMLPFAGVWYLYENPCSRSTFY